MLVTRYCSCNVLFCFVTLIVFSLCTEEHCKSPMYVSYRRARSGDFDVTVEAGVSGVVSGLLDPTQALRGSSKRWQMPTDPHATYTFRVK